MIEKLLKKAEGSVRLHVLKNKVLEYRFKNQKLDIINESISKIYYVRVIYNKKLGSAYCYSENEVEEAYKRAIKNSIPFNADDFPEIGSTRFEFYEKKLRDAEFDELGEKVSLNIKNVILQDSYIGYIEQEGIIMDSYGNELISRKNYVNIHSSVTLENREFGYGNTGHNIEFLVNDVKHTLEEKIKNTEKPVKFSGKTNIELFYDPSATFIDLLFDGFIGKEVEEKNVWTWNKFGEEVVPGVTVEENPDLPLVGKNEFDDDGVPTRKKKLIDNGTLISPVYDYYSAKKYEKESTGNGFFAPEYAHGIGFTNIEIDSKNTYNIENGIIAYEVLGFHTCNKTTGDIKLVISHGALVKNGEIIGGVRNLGFSGNLAEFLKKLCLTKEKKEYKRYYLPKLILNDISIV